LTSQVTGLYNIADETRTILANSYLELQQIRENTGEIVKPIKQMQTNKQIPPFFVRKYPHLYLLCKNPSICLII
jgi:hypothetical protein